MQLPMLSAASNNSQVPFAQLPLCKGYFTAARLSLLFVTTGVFVTITFISFEIIFLPRLPALYSWSLYNPVTNVKETVHALLASVSMLTKAENSKLEQICSNIPFTSHIGLSRRQGYCLTNQLSRSRYDNVGWCHFTPQSAH